MGANEEKLNFLEVNDDPKIQNKLSLSLSLSVFVSEWERERAENEMKMKKKPRDGSEIKMSNNKKMKMRMKKVNMCSSYETLNQIHHKHNWVTLTGNSKIERNDTINYIKKI